MSLQYWSVPRSWPGETVAVVATGPSLTQDQLLLLRRRVPVIVISENYLLAPWADFHYICDKKVYDWHRECKSPAQHMVGRERAMALWHGFHGVRMVLESAGSCSEHEPSLKVLRNDSRQPNGTSEPLGLCEKPDGVRTGRNSGYQAVNLAYHTGAARILLLGFDMRVVNGRSHWFGEHPDKQPNSSSYLDFIKNFDSLAAALKAKGVSVINCTPGSALTAFKRGNLADLL